MLLEGQQPPADHRRAPSAREGEEAARAGAAADVHRDVATRRSPRDIERACEGHRRGVSKVSRMARGRGNVSVEGAVLMGTAGESASSAASRLRTIAAHIRRPRGERGPARISRVLGAREDAERGVRDRAAGPESVFGRAGRTRAAEARGRRSHPPDEMRSSPRAHSGSEVAEASRRRRDRSSRPIKAAARDGVRVGRESHLPDRSGSRFRIPRAWGLSGITRSENGELNG